MRFPITHGPTMRSDELNFVDAGTVRCTPAQIIFTGKRKPKLPAIVSIISTVALYAYLLASGSDNPILREVRFYLIWLWIIPMYIPVWYAKKERSLILSRHDVQDVAWTENEVAFLLCNKRKPRIGLLTAHTPEMAAAMAAALRDDDGGEHVFAIHGNSNRPQSHGKRGRVTVLPDAIQLDNFFSLDKQHSNATRHTVINLETLRHNGALRWLLGSLVATVLIGIAFTVLPGVFSRIPWLPNWQPGSFVMYPVAIVIMLATLMVVMAARFSSSNTTVTLRKFAIAELVQDGRDIAFTAQLDIPDTLPERIVLHADTPEAAEQLVDAITTYNAPRVSIPIGYGPAANAPTLKLSGKGSIKVEQDTVSISGLTPNGLTQVLIPLIIGLAVFCYMLFSGNADLERSYLGYIPSCWLIGWAALAAIPVRRRFPRTAISNILVSGRQVAFDIHTPKGTQRAVVHTQQTIDAAAVGEALAREKAYR